MVFIKVFFVVKINRKFFFMFELIELFLYYLHNLDLIIRLINYFTDFIKFDLINLHVPSLI